MVYTAYYLSAWQVEHRLINKTFSLIIFLWRGELGKGGEGERRKRKGKNSKNRVR